MLCFVFSVPGKHAPWPVAELNSKVGKPECGTVEGR